MKKCILKEESRALALRQALRALACVLLLLLTGCQPSEPAEAGGDYKGFFGTPVTEKRLGFTAKLKQTGARLEGSYTINGTKRRALKGTVTGKSVELVLQDVPKKVISQGETLDFWSGEGPLILSGTFKPDITEPAIYGSIELNDDWTLPWQLKGHIDQGEE